MYSLKENEMNETKIITSGSRAVVINKQDNKVWANLYLNAREGIQLADITLTRWQGKTVKGAETWATKILNK